MAARQWMARALGVIGFAALATGCTDDGVSLHAICPIPPEVSDDSCTWDPGSNLCVADGVLNLSAADYYRLNLKVESGLKARMRDVPPLAETNGLQIQRARVELRLPSGERWGFPAQPETYTDVDGMEKMRTLPALENPYWVSASGFVDPGGNAVVPITVIAKDYVDRFAKNPSVSQIVVAVTLHGKTSGTEEIESDEFIWPVRLIKANPLQIANECIPGIGYCLGSLGQDGFALACKDSASSN
ncbi:MAG: hypothetical protein ABW352_00525 [Polyangiales bacterium]